MKDGVVIFLDSYEEESSAVKEMHRMARRLRQRRITDRYGVFLERHPRFKTYELYLVDRQKEHQTWTRSHG